MTRRADPDRFNVTKDALLAGVFFALLVRWCVAAYPYSGYKKPPMYGDYEAQRHWQEITVHTPVIQWYHNTTQNDLEYWGLDYPPLTAYHSFLMGLVADWWDPESVRLFASRGYESESHKMFMRWTVFLSDMYFFVTAVLCLCIDLERVRFRDAHIPVFKRTDLSTVLMLLYPGMILIDHGHFQYNCVSLGLFLWATFFIVAIENDVLATMIFCLALNYKQMELYHALPFFVYLLRKCFIGMPPKGKLAHFLCNFNKLAIAVFTTFVIVWYPLSGSWQNILQVLHRLFPLKRGVFEDKVSNVWCFVNVFIKLKTFYTNETMAQMCLSMTAVASLPSCADMFFRINRKKFVLCLINVSLAFFLFSFQVHEKSILLVAIPVALHLPDDPFMSFWFLLVSNFSMLPLLIKDGLIIPFVGLNVIYISFFTICLRLARLNAGVFSFMNASLVYQTISQKRESSVFMKLLSTAFFFSLLGMFWLTIGSVCVEPPPQYPDLFPLLVSMYSCCHYVMFFIYFNYQQISIPFFLPKPKVKLN
ncbi:dolichyl pyrophosphate Man9GlcNAc2 alpha-1,3-glucosyltransferase [Ostrinia nubilalis]|uniref:dolichyl pyrophosphate Man9GlcNAc2 alpha-1,3-glucosyltransferase n=1 Tax=Ostrinia nubilalis TaxID=29057 RepID=UPI0030823F62